MGGFGLHLAQLREQAGLTQKALAAAAGLGHSTVASWELGRRSPRDGDLVEKLRVPLKASAHEMDTLYKSAGLPLPRRGLANQLESDRLRLSDTASWLARYPWVCLIQNERHELLAWNRPANLVAELDLATVLPRPEDRNILWMAVLDHFRDVRLTNWDELMGGFISVVKSGVPDLGAGAPLWMQHLINKVMAQYPEVLQRLLHLWQTVPTWRDGARNAHRVEWMTKSGQRLEFIMVSRAWNLHDGMFVMDWHPMDSATWAWLEAQPLTGPESTVYVEPPLPWHVQFERTRKGMELTRKELAARSGLAEATIYAIERNKRRPSREVVLQLARALSMPGSTMNDILEQLNYPTEPSDFASWLMGEPRELPFTSTVMSPHPMGEPVELIQAEVDSFAWPAIVLNESCEVFVVNPAAEQMLGVPNWMPAPDRPRTHFMDVLLSDQFRLRCPNWPAVVRDILPNAVVPLVLGRNPETVKPPIRQVIQRVRQHSPATYEALSSIVGDFGSEDAPRVATAIEWEAPDGKILRFHAVADVWNSYDPYWAIDLHPADSATWRWFGR